MVKYPYNYVSKREKPVLMLDC